MAKLHPQDDEHFYDQFFAIYVALSAEVTRERRKENFFLICLRTTMKNGFKGCTDEEERRNELGEKYIMI